MLIPAELCETLEDTRGFWVMLRDDDGDLVTLAGPFATRNEAEDAYGTVEA